MADVAFWVIQVPGWALLVYLITAQCVSAIRYDIGVRIGTQEPAEAVTEVGVAFWKGFAFGDLVFYSPLLFLGLVGQVLEANWSQLILGAALGVTVYWPIVCLWTVRSARGATGWSLPKERQYWIVLPIICAWGLCGLILLWLSSAGA